MVRSGLIRRHRHTGWQRGSAGAGRSRGAALHQRGEGPGVPGLGSPADDGGAPVTGYEYRETLAEENIRTTGTTATIRGLDDGLLFYAFEVRAVNAVGEGEWSDEIYTSLWPERNEQVRVSPTSITVTEGGTFTFTVSLNRAPPLPVGLGLYPRGSAETYLGEAYDYLDRVLIPNGWSHPYEYEQGILGGALPQLEQGCAGDHHRPRR